MKDRTFPLWLLRDVPALLGVMLSFWPLVILVIVNGEKAMRGKKINPVVYEHLMAMLPVAEARLHFALHRQAFRAFGWSLRHVPRPPVARVASWEDFGPRFEAYRRAIMDLNAAARTFTQSLRHAYRIRARIDATTVHAAHARAARQANTPIAATTAEGSSLGALILRTPKAVSKDEGGLANARGPPPHSLLPIPCSLRKRQLPKTHRHVRP
jgi:hypothetical protein